MYIHLNPKTRESVLISSLSKEIIEFINDRETSCVLFSFLSCLLKKEYTRMTAATKRNLFKYSNVKYPYSKEISNLIDNGYLLEETDCFGVSTFKLTDKSLSDTVTSIVVSTAYDLLKKELNLVNRGKK
jgi:hypothetical protein